MDIIFSDDSFFQQKIKKGNFFVFYHRRLYKLIITPIISKYRKSQRTNQFTNEIIRQYLTKTHENQDERTVLCILRLVYEFGVEDNLLFSNVLAFAQKTSNAVIKYWLIQSIETFAFWRTITLPNDYYILRKQMIKELCISLIPDYLNQKSNNHGNEKKRLCIVAYLLGDSLKNSVQRVLKMITDNVDKAFFDISVVCLDSLYCKKDNIANIHNWSNSFRVRKKTKQLLNKDIQIYYCNSNSIKEKMKSSLELIYNINPDLILDISDEYSVTSFVYSKAFPTIYLPLRGRVTSSFCNIYKTSDLQETIKQNSYYHNILSNIKIVEWSFPEYVMNSNTIYTRKQFQLNDNSFIMVSAGILPQNDKKFLETMISILELNKNFVWIMVGSNFPEYFIQQHNSFFLEKRIIEWGYEKNLDSLYRICDVFVNPNKTGGSGTIAIAAQQKLPIVLTDFPCDAMRWIKNDNCISNGYDGFLDEVIKLHSDENYYSKKSQLFYNLVCEANDSKTKWDKFNQILKDSIIEWQEEQKRL